MRSVVGTWRVVRTSATSADGSPLPPPFGGEAAIGRLVLTADGRMASVLCDGRKEIPPGQVRGYSSYCGNYRFDGTTLVTRVDAASDPARMGTDQVRQVSFEGDLMVLRPPLVSFGAGAEPEQRVLHWQKIADE